MRMLVQAHEENCKQLEFEKKKAESNAENGISQMCPCKKESQRLIPMPIKRGNIK
uniref:Uncharacterized protein n=1 Tax=Rhizophora mucronata TaxID=61149 RepID=A0A2P2QD99_RHIMU